MALFEVLTFSAIIILVVSGLGIVANMMGVFNFAHGELVLLGAYITYLAYSLGLPIWAGMVAAPFIVGALGFVLERLVVRRFYIAPVAAMVATYALGLVIREAVRGLIGGLYLAVPDPLGGSFQFGDLYLSKWRCVIVVVTVIVMCASYALLTLTSFGLRVRASLENPALARASGISTSLVYSATFAFGAALAGLAGALIVPIFTLFADLGIRFLLQGFVAVMVGGAGSFAGSLAGAGIVGVLNAALPWVMAPVIADVLAFLFAIAFIKIRPRGLV
jgi:branched-chain amino acid transport system permease protein